MNSNKEIVVPNNFDEKEIQSIKETPNFKEQKIILSNQIQNDKDYISCFEVFKLKAIEDSFYIAFSLSSPESVGALQINKYNQKNFQCEKIYEKKDDDYYILSIKYFYAPPSGKEYLFINKNNMIFIYLIKNEKEIENVYNEQFDKSIKNCDYKIIYNKFNKKCYLIKSSFTMEIYPIPINYLKIFEFKETTLIIKTSFLYDMGTPKHLMLFHEDNITKNIYLFIIVEGLYKYILINDDLKDNLWIVSNFLENQKKNIRYDIFANKEEKENFIFYTYGCIIYRENDDDLIYLSDNYGNIIIFNLQKKALVKEIKLNMENIFINSLLNYNNKTIVIGSKNTILIMDVKSNKIIGKYKVNFDNGKKIVSLKTIHSPQKNFSFLFVEGSDKNIRIFL